MNLTTSYGGRGGGGVSQGLVAREGRFGGVGGGAGRQGRADLAGGGGGGRLGGGEGQIWWGGGGGGEGRSGGGGQIWRHFIDNLSPSCCGQGVNMAVSGA